MKRKENRKEILTYANIRRDLRRKLWRSWLLLFFFAAVTIGFIWAFHQIPALLFKSEMGSRSDMPGWMFLLMIPFLLYACIKETWLVSYAFCRTPCIVKDTLVSSEGDTNCYSYSSSRTAYCTLHFNGYGDYAVPEKNYLWSKEYAMTAAGVYNMAFDGGEYYLVLSKPHNGKILLAYNAELFQLEGASQEQK